NEIIKGVSILDAGKFSGRLNRMINAPNAVYRLAKSLDADLYHLHDPELIPIGLKLKKLGKKVVFDAHEDLPNQVKSKHYIPKPFRIFLPIVVNAFERYTCSKFDGVIVAAEPVIKDKFLKINPRTIVVNNYPLLEELVSLSNNNKIPNQICYIGGLAETRGIVELVESIKLSENNVKLVVAGNFPTKELEDKVRKIKGWNQVDFQGYVDRQSISNILENSYVGMVTLHPTPSYLNSMPVKMFEYMCAGLPVVASNFPLWEDIIDSFHCGLCVDPLNPNDIAEAVDYLLDNPEIAYEMGKNGRRVVLEKYNWTNEKNNLLNFYSEILSEHL
ncbi:MAG: glycosyltransferase involved in cell wall biosynthesis, partial [Psychrobacter glaciei]